MPWVCGVYTYRALNGRQSGSGTGLASGAATSPVCSCSHYPVPNAQISPPFPNAPLINTQLQLGVNNASERQLFQQLQHG